MEGWMHDMPTRLVRGEKGVTVQWSGGQDGSHSHVPQSEQSLTLPAVNATPSPTPSAGGVVTVRSTFKRRVSFFHPPHSLHYPHFPLSPILTPPACAQCGYPAAKTRSFEWGQKAKRRKTTYVARRSHCTSYELTQTHTTQRYRSHGPPQVGPPSLQERFP